jgi:Eco57I restriction-modification methylase
MKSNFVTIDSGETKTIHEFIERHLEPNEREKKLFGEVFTPLPLVQEMLGSIEKYAEEDFWKNPNLKILDPAAGIGNFPLIAYEKLMEGLKSVKGFKGEEARRKHILEKMLYMVELNPNNVRLMNKIFNGKKYKLNVLCSDFLLETEEDVKQHDGLSSRQKADGKRLLEWKKSMKFDLVMGNPPYQPQSNGKKGGKSLWTEFVKVSIDLIKEKKFLVFVHPALWRKPENEMREWLFANQLHHLVIRNSIEGEKLFSSATRFDWYVLEKCKPYKKTRVNFEDYSECDMKIDYRLPFIPNFGWSIFNKVLRKLNNNGIKAQRDSACHTTRPFVSKVQKDGYNFVLLNSVSTTKGKNYAYSKTPHPHQTDKKVIFSNGGIIVPFYDNGNLGVTEGGIYILVDSSAQGELLVDFLNSNLVKYLVKATKWSNFETNKQLFWYIPQPIEVDSITDENVYLYFNLTKQEIKEIETTL